MTTNNDLSERVSAFRCLKLPGQPMMMHMGTSSLVGDLWNEVKALQEQLELARVKTYCTSISEIAVERDALLEALIHIQQVACSGSPELSIATEAITKSTGSPA